MCAGGGSPAVKFMDINVTKQNEVTVVQVVGEIDGSTAPVAQEQILPAVQAGGKVLLDMSRLEFMSSAGLRMMLLLHRQATTSGGRVVLVGLSEEIQDTMSATGFLGYFTVVDTLEAGQKALQQ